MTLSSTYQNKVIEYACLGDVHTFSKRNPTKRILNNIVETLGLRDKSTELKIIFFEGDFFDELVDLSRTDELGDLFDFIGKLFRFAVDHNVKIRILEGTPLHDWKQSELYTHISRFLGYFRYGVDFRFVKKLEVEVMDDLDLSVLYIPDEWNTDNSITYRQAAEAIREKGLEKVDLCIMHGAFRYQIPKSAKNAPSHDEMSYLDLVRYYIHVGHYHTHSSYDRIIAAGSVDRLSHGEEEAKGLIKVKIDRSSGESSWFFVENKNALVFKTLDLPDDGVASSELIRKTATTLEDWSHLRLRMNKTNQLANALDALRITYPRLYITKKINEDDDNDSVPDSLFSDFSRDDRFVPIAIHKGNVLEMITSEISNTSGLDDEERSRILEIGKQLL